jgi:hypothetical protein
VGFLLAARPVRRRDLVGTVRLPMDRLAAAPEGVAVVKVQVGDGWDDVIALGVAYQWDPVCVPTCLCAVCVCAWVGGWVGGQLLMRTAVAYA